ncbi:MAG: helix-turn-helix domain-containing protein [Acidimicrobiales bacterium]
MTRALEVPGERWSLLIVRDLLCGATRFNELAWGNCSSRSLLSNRLRQLERAGVIEHVGDDYLLTDAGRDLQDVVFGLGGWGARWQFDEPRESELDPELLMWWVHRRLDFSLLPDRRVVIEFRFRGEPRGFWIMKDSQGPSVCTTDPGFEIDATIESDLSTMYQVWLGKLPLKGALKDGRVVMHGAPAIVRRLPVTLELSPIAEVVANAKR